MSQRKALFDQYNQQLLKSLEKKAQKIRESSNEISNITSNRFTLERAISTPPRDRIRKSLSKSSRGTAHHTEIMTRTQRLGQKR